MRNKSILEKPVGGTSADIADAIAKKHTRQHAITTTADHTSTATAGKMLKADANGLPIDATNTDSDVASAVSLKHSNSLDHTQGTDTSLGVVGTKNPPIDADKVIYRDSTASDALVTSTWTQVKAFLKTYFDTLYNLYVHPNHSGDVTSVADGATTIGAGKVTPAMLENGTAESNFLVTGATPFVWVRKTLAEVKTLLGLASNVPAATAESDFIVSGASPFAWLKKTLAEAKTILGLVLTQTAEAVGFTLAGGTTSKTLTVTGNATISATPYTPGGTDVAEADGGTNASTFQIAINNITAVAGATNEHVLTKDTVTGNAIFKASAGGITQAEAMMWAIVLGG